MVLTSLLWFLLSAVPAPLALHVTIPTLAYVTVQIGRTLPPPQPLQAPASEADSGAQLPAQGPGGPKEPSPSSPLSTAQADDARGLCSKNGVVVAQGRHLVESKDTLLLCSGTTPLALLSGVVQYAVAPLDDDSEPDLLVNWRPRLDAPLRLHVYGLKVGTLPPIWRGSGMSAVLDSFVLVPRDGKPSLLVTLERVGKTRRWVGHRWNKFGFVGICSAPAEGRNAGILSDCDGLNLACTADAAWRPQCKSSQRL